MLLLIGLSMTAVDTLYASAVSSFLADFGSLLAVVAIFYGAMYGKLGRRVFGAPWLCLIGTMCYSIYLVHVPLMQVVSDVVLRRLALHSAPAIWGFGCWCCFRSRLSAPPCFTFWWSGPS